MFGIPGKAPVTLTPRAVTQITRLMARDGAFGLKLGVKKGGCAGMEYTIGLVTEPNPKDDRIDRDGAVVWVEPAAVLYLLGTEMDFEVSTLRTGFTFHNPNQTSACGCGESVELKPADLAALAAKGEAVVRA